MSSMRAEQAAEQWVRGLYALRSEPSPEFSYQLGYEQAERDLQHREQEVRAEERERAARVIKEHREKDICRENCWTAITNEIRRDDTPQEGDSHGS